MEHLIMYCGACLMGIICLVSMLAVYSSNKRVLTDLKHPAEAKDKWTGEFMREHQNLLKENTEIHNPSVYVTKRMRGRKIGPWSIRQVKGISWGTFILFFLFAGIEILSLWRRGTENILIPLIGQAVSPMNVMVFTGAGMGIVLLGVRLLIGTGYQEEEIETNILDYIENRNSQEKKLQISEKRETKNDSRETEKTALERQTRQVEQGILEAAATDSRYRHLLNKDEEAIVKDVIKEFLT